MSSEGEAQIVTQRKRRNPSREPKCDPTSVVRRLELFIGQTRSVCAVAASQLGHLMTTPALTTRASSCKATAGSKPSTTKRPIGLCHENPYDSRCPMVNNDGTRSRTKL